MKILFIYIDHIQNPSYRIPKLLKLIIVIKFDANLVIKFDAY